MRPSTSRQRHQHRSASAAAVHHAELRRWIIEQAQAARSRPGGAANPCRDAGWDEDVAADAMEITLQEHLNDLARAKGPALVPVPGARAPAGRIPAQVDCGDRHGAEC